MNEKEYVDVAGIYEEISTSLGKKNLFLKALEVSTKNRAAFISSSGNSCAESSEDKAKGKAALVAITVEKESSEDFEDEFSDSFSDSISDEFMNKARLLFEENNRMSQSSSDYVSSLSFVTNEHCEDEFDNSFAYSISEEFIPRLDHFSKALYKRKNVASFFIMFWHKNENKAKRAYYKNFDNSSTSRCRLA